MKKLFAIIGLLVLVALPGQAICQFTPVPYPPQTLPGQRDLQNPSGPVPFGPWPGGPGPWYGGQGYDEGGRGRAYARGGYQWMWLETRFPVPGVNVNTSTKVFEDMTLTFKDANVWVGFLGLEVKPLPYLSLYGEIGSSVPRDSIVEMNATGRLTDVPPDLDANLVSPWEWTAADFRWAMVDAGVSFRLSPFCWLDAGFRAEHIDFRLTDPRNDTERIDSTDPVENVPGRAITPRRICPGCIGKIEGDPLSKVWTPYVGLRGAVQSCKIPTYNCSTGCTYRTDLFCKWRFRVSPLSYNSWTTHFDVNFRSADPAAGELEVHRTTYRLRNTPGWWLEGDLAAFANITPAVKAHFWSRGSWTYVKGTGESELGLLSSTILSFTKGSTGTPGVDEVPSLPLQPGSFQIPDSTFSQIIFGIGVGLDYFF
jgi:hypothetical protein